MQEIILRYCLKDSRHDAQSEDQRAPWLLSIIDLCDSPETYHDKIIEALSTEQDCWSLSQLFDLCLLLAKRGNIGAEKAIFNRFDKQNFEESWQGASEIFDLKGLDGLAHVAKTIGQRMINDPNAWDGGAYYEACEIFGKEQVKQYLLKLSQNTPAIATYLQSVLDH